MGERWIQHRSRYGVVPEIDAFMAEIEAVCRKHNLSIAAGDARDLFEIDDFDDELHMRWLRMAPDVRDAPKDSKGGR